MIRIQVEYDATVITDGIQRVNNLGVTLLNKVKRNVRPVLNREAEAYFRRTPGAVSRPVRWKSNAQKRAAIARMKALGNYPYMRTGRINRNANRRVVIELRTTAKTINMGVRFRTATGKWLAKNTEFYGWPRNDYERFVRGPGQQPFHLNTGWQNIETEIARLEKIARPLILEQWKTSRIFKGGEKL